MRDRGKAIEKSATTYISDCSSSSNPPCRKHPSSSSSSSVGICALCLKDRLIKLVCSDCGEPRLSSCSCSSDISSTTTFPNSSSIDVGSVGRISFLIENENPPPDEHDARLSNSTSNSNLKVGCGDKPEAIDLLKRTSSSSSTCVGVKRSGFWNLGKWRLFGKRKEKRSFGEMWSSDHLSSVSRSKSVSGFRGCFDGSQGGIVESQSGFSGIDRCGSAECKGILLGDKRGDFVESEGGFSGVRRGGLLEFEVDLSREKRGGGEFLESEGGFLGGVEESGFIDLKLDFSTESKSGFGGLKGGFTPLESEFEGLRSEFLEHECSSVVGGVMSNGSSCRITVNDSGIKQSKKRLKVWKWILRQPSGRTAKKNQE